MKKPTTISTESVSEYREFIELRLRKRVLEAVQEHLLFSTALGAHPTCVLVYSMFRATRNLRNLLLREGLSGIGLALRRRIGMCSLYYSQFVGASRYTCPPIEGYLLMTKNFHLS